MLSPSVLKYVDRISQVKLIGVTTGQQLIAVTSTFALMQAGLSLGDQNSLIKWLAIALACHVIVPFFGLIQRPLETALGFSAYKNFLEENLLNKAQRPGIWQEKHQKELFISSIGSEAENYLAVIIFLGLDLFTFILSIGLGVLAIGLTLDTTFIPAYIMSGLLSFFAFKYFQRIAKAAAESEQHSRSKFESYLFKAWENIFFKNSHVVANYIDNFNSHLNDAKIKSRHSSLMSETMVAALTFIASLPVIIAVFVVISRHNGDVKVMAAILAAIPRQLNMLATFRTIFQTVSSLVSFEAKFSTMKANAILSEAVLSSRISVKNITVQNEVFSTLEDLSKSLSSSLPSRIQIRGSNGAGKSTLMLHLNESLESSFYIPAHPQFEIADAQEGSTGQKMLRHIEYAASLDNKHLLLDEWDANLDQENIFRINDLLNRISKDKVIIEVRHR
ncbi:hypothetical protein DOM22_10590 [Bdellovibrio sp. ZAP7]|uniref:ATP-binding cassette domain-containing protein n=1 Tax=Bdellovibrio sp. ZAP7 TaxID=2231053 RepID=UPI001157B024|nr:ABC transporter ATP-binding protein [Bdellovibrio sp. ZAP7]QDK45564.1 hypothetical protein DOM22_10590 [Bdellovibrio sp. ZAP7]